MTRIGMIRCSVPMHAYCRLCSAFLNQDGLVGCQGDDDVGIGTGGHDLRLFGQLNQEVHIFQQITGRWLGSGMALH